MKRLSLILLFIFISVKPPIISADETTRLIVKYRPHVSEERIQGLRLRAPRSRLLRISSARKTEVINSLQQSDLIEYVEEDQPLEALEIPSDTEYPKQWALTKINTPPAWDVSKSGSQAQIAILDSGVTKTHVDLQGKVVMEANFTDDKFLEDRFGHGTHVAGIAAASTNNGLGIAGVGYNAQIISGKVLNRYGRGYYSWLINALYWAADNGAEVINMSIGGSSNSQALQDAVNYAWNKGIVIVAAAGNSSSQSPVYPASYPNVIAVAATDQNDKKASFSSYGSWVDLAAPGVSIISLDDDGDYVTGTGTSMAAPHVAGVAALLWGSGPNQNIVNRLYTTAIPITGTGTYWQYGRLDAAAALGVVPRSEAEIPSVPVPSAVEGVEGPSPSPSPSPRSTRCQRFSGSRRCQ